MQSSARSVVAGRWPALALAILMPVWLIGLFGRGLWTPDEPREYDIAVGMLQSGDQVTPQLAGQPFVEKPPLAYWLPSASMSVFGPSSAAARLPNLIWAAITILCIGWLAGDVVGRRHRNEGALIAALSCGTLVLLLQVQIWLATDAPLLATTALALLSTWRLAGATDSRRWAWALLLGASLAGAFLAKNGFGLLIPGLTIVIWLAWERRLLELMRWPWWVALGCFVLLAGSWLAAFADQPGGRELVRGLLWDNLLARLLPVQSHATYDLGHRSSHWNFLVLLPVYMVPWTFAFIYAARWGVRASITASEARSAVRFCIAAVVPACMVLLLSRTARGVYFAPVLLGLPVLLALWITATDDSCVAKQRALRLTRIALLTLSAVLALCMVALLILGGAHLTPIVMAAASTAIIFAVVRWYLRTAAGATRGLVAAAGTFVAALAALAAIAFPSLDRAQGLAELVATAERDLQESRFALYCGDETTRATLDYVSELRPPNVCSTADAQRLLGEHGDQQFLVLLAPPRSAERVRELLPRLDTSRWKSKKPRSTKRVSDLESLGLKPIASWSVPGGRRYALYGRETNAALPTGASPGTPTSGAATTTTAPRRDRRA